MFSFWHCPKKGDRPLPELFGTSNYANWGGGAIRTMLESKHFFRRLSLRETVKYYFVYLIRLILLQTKFQQKIQGLKQCLFAQNAPAFAQKSFGLDFRVERSLGIRGYTSLLYGQNPQGT